MTPVLALIDKALNTMTMYKGIAFGLIGLLVTGGVLAQLNLVGIDPHGLVVSTLTLTVSCFIANYVFARLFKVPYNSESWLITGLILACIVAPSTDLDFVAYAVLTGVIAMASKYVVTWRGNHILNPAAIGALVVSLTGLVSINWWVATPWMTPIVILGALITLRKHRKFTLFAVFAATAVSTMLLVNLTQEQAVSDVLKAALLSWPIIFFGSIMLTEPTTLPAGRYNQLLVAVIVGALFASQQHIGPVSASPQLALVAGNILGAFLAPPFGAMFRVKRITKLSGQQYEVVFARPRGFRYRAGQYMDWTLPHANADIRGNRRTFSIASAPSEDEVRIAIRVPEKSSTFKRALLSLKPTSKIRAANIGGEFTLVPGAQPLLFIAGGIGITPFRSMIAEQITRQIHRDVELIYVASSADDFIYKELFEKARAFGVKTHYLVGRLDGDKLERKVIDIKQRAVYISGPPAMVDAIKQIVRAADVRSIHTDHFNGY